MPDLFAAAADQALEAAKAAYDKAPWGEKWRRWEKLHRANTAALEAELTPPKPRRKGRGK